ncbi:adenylate/guanylate cyclase domain-containing protein [Candidatus Riflebacteria bacterium]
MDQFSNINVAQKADLLIAFTDIKGFVSVGRKLTDLQLFQLMADYFAMFEKHLKSNNGYLVKCIGDSALIIFPQEFAENGILALKELKQKAESFMKKRGFPTMLDVKVHFGPVVIGKVTGILDVYGMAVNKTALLKSDGFSISAEAFRRLSPESRKLFKKHTPAYYYIPVEYKHNSN